VGGIGLTVRWLAEVRVSLRSGIADPEGQTIGSDADDHAAAEATVGDMCRRLLANPVMETASWELRADEPTDVSPGLPA
jgi:phosphoribosylformylglycinamidine (FGAM) synthase PurS component